MIQKNERGRQVRVRAFETSTCIRPRPAPCARTHPPIHARPAHLEVSVCGAPPVLYAPVRAPLQARERARLAAITKRQRQLDDRRVRLGITLT